MVWVRINRDLRQKGLVLTRLMRFERLFVILDEQILKSPEDLARLETTVSATTYRNMKKRGVRPKTLRAIMAVVNKAIVEHNKANPELLVETLKWTEAVVADD